MAKNYKLYTCVATQKSSLCEHQMSPQQLIQILNFFNGNRL